MILINLKVAYTPGAKDYFETKRQCIDASTTDFTDISVAVVTDKDTDVINDIYKTMFGIPIFVFSDNTECKDTELKNKIYRWVNIREYDADMVNSEIDLAADQYELRTLPPFFEALNNYVARKNQQFNCPGHQGENTLKSIRLEDTCMIFSEKTSLHLTCAMPMLN